MLKQSKRETIKHTQKINNNNNNNLYDNGCVRINIWKEREREKLTT